MIAEVGEVVRELREALPAIRAGQQAILASNRRIEGFLAAQQRVGKRTTETEACGSQPING